MSNENLIHTRALINTFVDRATNSSIAKLHDSFVMVEGNVDSIAQVVGISGRELQWQTRYHLCGSPNNITPYAGTFTYQNEMNYIGKDSKVLSYSDESGPQSVEYKRVFGYTPRAIIVGWGAYTYDDSVFNAILDEGLSEFPRIESYDDIAKLTRWINKMFPYKSATTNPGIRHFNGLGSHIKKELVCTHLALIELAILRLRGVKTTPIEFATHPDSGHAALIVNLSSESRLYTDPTLGECTDLNRAVVIMPSTWGIVPDAVKGFNYTEAEIKLV